MLVLWSQLMLCIVISNFIVLSMSCFNLPVNLTVSLFVAKYIAISHSPRVLGLNDVTSLK